MGKTALGSILFAGAVLAVAVTVQAQQPGKIPRVGFLGAASAPALGRRLAAFREGLRELGYIEGTNIAIDYRYADSQADRISPLAAELLALKPAVIVTYQTPSVLAIKNLSPTMPIVFAIISFPIENGIIASFARPGGNATGLTVRSEELNGKRLELLKQSVPSLERVAVLSNPANPTQPLEWKGILGPAQGLGLKLDSVEVRSSNDFENAFEKIVHDRAQALLFLPEAVFAQNEKRIVAFEIKNKLPSIYESSNWAEVGGLMSYGPIYTESFHRAAAYVDKILKGTKPADMPVEQPSNFELVINLKTAKQIGLIIPQRVLLKADRVIK